MLSLSLAGIGWMELMDAIILCALTFLSTTRFLFPTSRGLVHQGDPAGLCCQGTHPLLLEGLADSCHQLFFSSVSPRRV